MKNRRNIVTGSIFNISHRANIPEKETMEALEILMAPDTKRIEPQPYGGRRIERLGPEEWLVLNGDKYQKELIKVHRQSYQAEWAAKQRELKRLHSGQPLSGEGLREQVSGDAAVAESLEARKEIQ